MDFKIESERSTILAIFIGIAVMIFSIYIGGKIGILVGTLISAFLGYIFLTANSTLQVHGDKLTIENINGLPAKKKTFKFDLKQVEQIDIIQTHQGRYDRKYMVVYGNFEPTEINMNFRYFQLVKIQNFFNEQREIKVILKG